MDTFALGTHIKDAREKLGLTQEDLAEIVGYSVSHVSVLERGVKAPRLEGLIDIANALHVGLDELLRDDLAVSNTIRASAVSDRLAKLPPKKQRAILNVMETMLADTEDA